MEKILVKDIESKSIVWFEPTNQYVVLESITGNIIRSISKKQEIKVIASELVKELDIPYEKAIDFIIDLEEKIVQPNLKSEKVQIANQTNYKKPDSFEFVKYYYINSKYFTIQYESEFELSLVHPKFAHLEIEYNEYTNYSFDFYTDANYTFLIMNDALIGSWGRKEIHYFQGKVSMKIIEAIYDKIEENWIGVFHASAVAYNDKSLLILGESGNGKSTSLALLQANGLKCVADDFVPIDNKENVHSFPAGISIKKKALDALLPMYPELKTSAEYFYKRLNKTVRYLQPKEIDFDQVYPCTALVFIKYDKNVEFNLEKISNLEAFESLLPDSWISQQLENVSTFLDWYSSLPCYRLTYSNNTKMVDSVRNLLSNEH